MRHSLFPFLTFFLAAITCHAQDAPKAVDPRLEVIQFADEKQIVHPVSMTFDAKGRLLVIESHTHFRPKDYKGPPHDRVQILEDTDGDGKADKITTFFEGTKATMDIATHPNGSIYLATRNEIIRLRDTKGTGKADDVKRIVFLDTKGDYPHNGLSGLSFDYRGNVTFGMGENLGAAYKLIGSDGVTIANEGDGGNIFTCTADGKKLRKIATGFWNPFGTCYDQFGRLFAVENDPDAMPPCRLLHIVEGGDYGYQFRYGRTGRHPFQSWHGELEGTLGMVSGTGEAPCEVLDYQADGLPAEYRGNLYVTSWADHRVERYVLKPHGASVKADRVAFVQGGKDFRPVGLAVAPDGSMFFSDWVLRDYNLHHRGAVWHLRMKDRSKKVNFDAYESHKLARAGEKGRADLLARLKSPSAAVRAAAARALAGSEKGLTDDALLILVKDKSPEIRAFVLEALLAQIERFEKDNPLAPRGIFQPAGNPSIADRIKALGETAVELSVGVRSCNTKGDLDLLLALLRDSDPFIRNAVVQQLATHPELLKSITLNADADARLKLGVLRATRESGLKESRPLAAKFLQDPDPEVRFFAAKWISDDKLTEHTEAIRKSLEDPKLSPKLFFAYATALARVEDRPVHEDRMAEFFVAKVADAKAPASHRLASLLQVPNSHKGLSLDLLANLLKTDDATLKLEAVRAMQGHPEPKRFAVLSKVVGDSQLPTNLRAEAIVGLAEKANEHAEALVDLASGTNPSLAPESLRALVGVSLKGEQKTKLESSNGPGELRDRVLGKPFTKSRPKLDDTAAWLKHLEGPADAEAGRRIFFQPKLAQCSRCHRIDGRGANVGPELSGIGRTERRHILESILQPSLNVAPNFQTWQLEMESGKILTGMLLRTYLDEYTYLDANGGQFKINTREVAETRPVPQSIMPDRLVDTLTDQELRDLLAYLQSRK